VHRYKAWNAPMPTTAALAKVTTGTSIKTMLQLATPSTRQMKPISWGYSLDAAPAGSGTGIVELIQTDVAATVTAHVASGLQPMDPNAPPSLLTLGSSASGYSASVEGSITATRSLDSVLVAGATNGTGDLDYEYQFMPEEWAYIAVSKFLRVRVTFSAAVNMLCWVTWDE
jgi:hypothetical protein